MKTFSLLILLFFGIQFQGFSQLDAVSVELSYVPSGDTLSGVPSVFKVHVAVNSLDYVGNVSVDIYESPIHRHIQSIVLTKAELISKQLIEGNSFTITFTGLPDDRSYQVETTLQDQQSAYFAPILNTFNPN